MEHVPMTDYIGKTEHVSSVFGFMEPCELYGGRPYNNRQISDADIVWMYDNGIDLRIPIQNLLTKKEHLIKNLDFLKKYDRPGNTVIIANDQLVQPFRELGLSYSIECSVIRRVNSVDELVKILDLYDEVVADPTWLNHQPEIVPQELRHRVRLFLNAGCMFHCQSRICYTGFSQMNLGRWSKRLCEINPQTGIRAEDRPFVVFDINDYLPLGYHKFKLLRQNGHAAF